MPPWAIALIVLACVVGIPLAGSLAYLLVFLPLTLRSMRMLPAGKRKTVEGITTIEDAAAHCRASGLSGWELVAHAQELAAKRFEYSRRNPWDGWEGAFARGMGYCIQQAMALKRLYDRLGVTSWPVQSFRVSFPAHVVHGVSEPAGTSGHMWLRVSVNGEVRDVCPGRVGNLPGTVHFTARAPVRRVAAWTVPLLHVLSAAENVRRDRKSLKGGVRQ